MSNSLGVSLGVILGVARVFGCKSPNILGGVGCVPLGTPQHPNYDCPLEV